MSSKPVVAHIFSRAYLDSTNYSIYNMLSNLSSFDAIVLTRKLKNLQLFPYPTSKIFSISNLPMLKKIHNYSALFTFRLLDRWMLYPYFLEVIKTEGPSLIHAHFGNAAWAYLKLKKKACVPMVSTFYGADISIYPRTQKWRNRYEELFREGEKFIALSYHMKNKMMKLGCPEEKIEICHLTVDVKRFKFTSRIKKDEVKFLFVSRFIEKKGIPILLNAFSKLIKEGKKVKLSVIGDGPLRTKIATLIQELNLSKKVALINGLSVPNPRQFIIKSYLDHDIFVLPSITARNGDEDGTPVALMEAQSTGMPVISTYIAGIPEVVVDGRTGILVPPDDPDGLAEKMKYLVDHPELWAKMGREGRAHIEKEYNMIVEAKKLEQIYRRVIS